MTTHAIREGFHTVTPYLIVEGAGKLIDFVKQAFEGEELFRASRPDGGIQHAEVKIGGSMIELAEATARYQPMPAAIHLYVKDADAVYQRAIQAGATSLYQPMDQEYGDREGGVKDPCSNQWFIGTHQGGRGYIPEGLRSVTPYLRPRGAAKLIDFLKQAFGAQEAERTESSDGIIHDAKIRIGDSIVELGEAHGEWQPAPAVIHLYVEDVDAVYRSALQAGAISLSEPADQPYGDRSAGVTDAWANHWYLATHLKE